MENETVGKSSEKKTSGSLRMKKAWETRRANRKAKGSSVVVSKRAYKKRAAKAKTASSGYGINDGASFTLDQILALGVAGITYDGKSYYTVTNDGRLVTRTGF